jgi:Zn finger protein HypA/HybF involved in hydrogenase expression
MSNTNIKSIVTMVSTEFKCRNCQFPFYENVWDTSLEKDTASAVIEKHYECPECKTTNHVNYSVDVKISQSKSTENE